jgi:hypothetical protein
MQAYNKAIAAFIGGVVAMIAIWWPPIGQYLTVEMQAALVPLLAALFTWAAPANKPRE